MISMLLAILASHLLATVVVAQVPTIKTVVAFGGSHSDNGNYFKDPNMAALLNANDFSYAYYGSCANVTNAGPLFAPNTTVLASSIPDITKQYENFQNDNKAKTIDAATTLYTVFAGPEDLLYLLNQKKIPDVNDIAASVVNFAKKLVNDGAKHIMIAKICLLEIMPFTKDMSNNAVAQIKSSVNRFNDALSQGLAEISNSSAKIILTDTYGLYSYMAQDDRASQFFPIPFEPCYDEVLNQTCPVSVQDEYFFFDKSHITEKAASFWAQYAWNQVNGVQGYFKAGTKAAMTQLGTNITKDVKTIIAFGGGISDWGNFYKKYNMAYPPSPPYFEGRYSNGPAWVEQFAELLNNATLLDNAFIGACADVSNAKNATIVGTEIPAADQPDQQQQFEIFKQSEGYVKLQDGATLVTIDSGSEDLIYFGGSSPTPNQAQMAEKANEVAGIILQFVQTLATFGAKQIMVSSLPPLDLMPFTNKDLSRAEVLKTLVDGFNDGLQKGIGQLISNFPAVQVYFSDVSSLYRQYKTNKYFPHPDDACITRNGNNFTICDNPDDYAFWDDYHPTKEASKFWAYYARNQVKGIEGVYPDGVKPPQPRVDPASPLTNKKDATTAAAVTVTRTDNQKATSASGSSTQVASTVTAKTDVAPKNNGTTKLPDAATTALPTATTPSKTTSANSSGPTCDPRLPVDSVTNPCPVNKPTGTIASLASLPTPNDSPSAFKGDAVQTVAKMNLKVPAALGTVNASSIASSLFTITESVVPGVPVSFKGAEIPKPTGPGLNAVVLLLSSTQYAFTAVPTSDNVLTYNAASSSSVNVAITDDGGVSITYVLPNYILSEWYVLNLRADGKTFDVVANTGNDALVSVTFQIRFIGGKRRDGGGFTIVTAVAPVVAPNAAGTASTAVSSAVSASTSASVATASSITPVTATVSTVLTSAAASSVAGSVNSTTVTATQVPVSAVVTSSVRPVETTTTAVILPSNTAAAAGTSTAPQLPSVSSVAQNAASSTTTSAAPADNKGNQNQVAGTTTTTKGLIQINVQSSAVTFTTGLGLIFMSLFL
ncbi:hypothetical protein BCR33DRAFT_842526 [Rhizoclosmatium globosum]|uniref:SGNH hydrolase n=1 Tax=Rhizoclosmatium globosum TaxID=329046 RepID=A0A1Y2B3R9_9FUNG|nr:hypothetical protein BCR33DRAFT_842526 [Rhizoclosmatium globosum]|eukprot:ORY29478.1 hypothetical protein BCR33DRAFT_842526 [Rhizoclosmatium globosum]